MKESNTKLFMWLSLRVLLMMILQMITFFILFNKENAFVLSGFYWATQLTIVNIILLVVMMIMFKRQGKNYFSFLRDFNKANTFYFLKLLVPLVILAMVPNIVLSLLLYQDLEIGAHFLIGDIQMIFIILNVSIFPILQGLVEIMFYFSYIMPKLKVKTSNPWIYIGLPVFFLSIQHAFMPLKLDLLYMMYRSLMFLPFAISVGILMHKRPNLLPYLIMLHILMNGSFAMMYFM